MSVVEEVRAAAPTLPAAERRVAEVLVDEPEAVAFGTVASLAAQAGTSGPSVVRLARRLGHDGFTAMRDAVRAELGDRLALRPASERIRRPLAGEDVLARALAVEVANVERTLERAPAAVAEAVRLLSRRRARVVLLAGEAERGVAQTVADQLDQLRPGVELLDGSPVRAAARLATLALGSGDVVLAVDVRRYDAWVLEACATVRAAGCPLVSVTDAVLSPVAEGAAVALLVHAEGPGPFDSHVGTLALLHALAAGVAARLRGAATERLDRVEGAWRATSLLVDR